MWRQIIKVLKGETKDNHANGKEYARITETPYWNLMLNKRVLKTEEKHVET
jgi:hypothetical protein